jgi:hypothetical protein
MLSVDIIYLISISMWVCPLQCVPKKGGVTIITNDKDEKFLFIFFGLKDEKILTRTVIEWRICIYGLQKTEQRR